MINRTLSAVLMLVSASALAQSSTKPAHGNADSLVAAPQHLTLANLPRPAGKVTRLFDGRSLSGWTPWLGYADPSITYRASPIVKPIGASRSMAGDFAVRRIDGAPAIWVKGQIWGSLVHRADLSNYHLRLEYKWGERTWAPRERQPRNNGLLYHTHGIPGEVFGTWRPSVEFEIMQGSTGMIVMVGTKTRAHTDASLDPSLIAPHLRFRVGGRTVDMANGTATWNVEAATDAERPAGQWNTLDLYVLGDRALHVVNGMPVAEVRDMATIAADGTRRPLTHGQIQLQSEGAETWFRNITVEPIRSLPQILAAGGVAPSKF
jgi:hypothetical protein